VKFFLPSLLALIMLCGCKAKPAEPGEETEPAAVAQVQVYTLQPQAFTRTLSGFGTLAFPPESTTISVAFEAKLDKIYVQNGQTVARGAPLLTLIPSAAAAVESAQAQAELRTAKAMLANVQRLKQAQLATNVELMQARQGVDIAQAKSAAIAQQSTLHAPLSGVVSGLALTVGGVIPANSALLQLSAESDLQAHFGVSVEGNVAPTPIPGQAVQLTLPSGVTLAGHVRKVLTLDPQSQVVPVWASLDQFDPKNTVPASAGEKLAAGMPISAEIAVQQNPSALLLPINAILENEGESYVFVVEKNIAHKRLVQVLTRTHDQAEIASFSPGNAASPELEPTGLAPGQLVVVVGNNVLSDGMAVRAGETLAP
jgi:RND family efflux transporter MFP subunit